MHELIGAQMRCQNVVPVSDSRNRRPKPFAADYALVATALAEGTTHTANFKFLK